MKTIILSQFAPIQFYIKSIFVNKQTKNRHNGFSTGKKLCNFKHNR